MPLLHFPKKTYICTLFQKDAKMLLAILFVLCFVANGFVIDDHADPDSVKAELIRYLEEDDFDKTVSFAEAAVEYYRGRNDLMDMAGCYMTLGNAYQRMGQYEEAIRNYNLCSETMDQVGGPMAKVNKRYVLNNMAVMYLEMGEYDQAESMWNRCIASVNEADPGFLPQYNQDSLRCLDLATYYQNLAELRLAQADSDDPNPQEKIGEAIRFLEKSLDYSERYGAEPNKIVGRLTGLAKAYFEAGRTDDANHNLDTALQLATTLNDPYMLAAIHLLKGGVKLKLGQNENAERAYLDALSLAQENHFGEFEMEALSGAYESTKDSQPKRALAYFTQNVALKDSIYNKEQQALIRDFEVQYKMEEKEHELTLQREKNRQGKRLLALSATVALLLLVLLGVVLVVLRQRKRRNALKDHLLFVVAHDIKTPVQTQSQLLEMTHEHIDEMTMPEMKENLQALKVSADDLNEKLQNIIYWVKCEMGNAENPPKRFVLHDLADEVVGEMTSHIQMKSLTVVNAIPAEWTCLDDDNIVRMVLQNLLSNAVKFSWPNGEIKISANETSEGYWVAVSDKGMGIPKDKLQRLFNDVVTNSDGTIGEMGTGIGLFVTKQLMERHGGKVKLESEEGRGTTVSFTVKKA